MAGIGGCAGEPVFGVAGAFLENASGGAVEEATGVAKDAAIRTASASDGDRDIGIGGR